ARGLGCGGDVPNVLAGEEDSRIADVVRRVDVHLDVEEVLGHAQVRLQPRRHRRERFEQVREGCGVGIYQGFLRVDDVEVDGAFVRVDDDLDRVPDVVDVVALE